MSAPIAIVVHAHPSVSKGGSEIAAATLFQGLRRLGVPAVLVAAVAEDQRERLVLGPDEYAVFHDPVGYDHLYQLSAPGVGRQLRAVLEATGAADIVFHHFFLLGLNGLRAALDLPGRRGVLALHEFLAQCHNHGQMLTHGSGSLCERATEAACAECYPKLGARRFGLRRQLFQDVFARLEGFVAPSRFLAERFVQWGIPADRMHVQENGLLAAPPAPTPLPRRDRFVFGFFGQLNPFKGGDLLLRAAELAGPGETGMELRIHGPVVGQDDGFRDRLDRATAALPWLRFHGPYANHQVAALMADCDYVVVPSLWWENSPVVIQEAFAAGRPVICTGIGGMAEKVPDGVAGLHFRRGDAEDLLRAMREAADRPVQAALMAGLPKPIDAEAMARGYLAVLGRDAAAGTKKPSRKARAG